MTAPEPHGLNRLERRAAGGLDRLPRRVKALEAEYLARSQNPDGGFSGRAGDSDLYYTSFALRAAALLGAEDGNFWESAAGFLRARLDGLRDIVECLALADSVRLADAAGPDVVFPGERDAYVEAVLRTVEESRCPQGGYSKTPGGGISVYNTYLAVLCHEALGRRVPEPEAVAGAVRTLWASDGGFRETAAGEVGGTNPTAAGLAVLDLLGLVDFETAEAGFDFLAGMQRSSGGFAAHARAPEADLLSTFTALVALDAVARATGADLGGSGRLRLGPVARYVGGLAAPTGGFRGSATDDSVDVEYTFYGVGALGILGAETATERSCGCSDSRCCGP